MKNPELKISFKKFLINPKCRQKGQSVIEYSLLLVVITILSLTILLPRVTGSNNIFIEVVDSITHRIGAD